MTINKVIWDTTPKVGYMDIKTINSLLDEINADRTVPKNIRISVQKAKEDLKKTKKDILAIKQAFAKVNDKFPLVPVHEALKGKHTYDELRLARLFLGGEK